LIHAFFAEASAAAPAHKLGKLTACGFGALLDAGLPVKAVVTATALSSTLASLLCGLTANLPVGLSPGMGLNAYLVFSQVWSSTELYAHAVPCMAGHASSALIIR